MMDDDGGKRADSEPCTALPLSSGTILSGHGTASHHTCVKLISSSISRMDVKQSMLTVLARHMTHAVATQCMIPNKKGS